MRTEMIRRPFRLHLLGGLAEGKRFGLGKYVGKKHIVVLAKRIEWFIKRNEIARNESGPLMDQLIKGVLAIRSRLSPIDWARVVGDFGPIERHVLAIALHGQLL